MNNTPHFWHYVLYFYYGFRYILILAKKHYHERNNDFENDDIMGWGMVLLVWPIILFIDAVFGVRGTAIRLAFYYGLMPWQVYEEKKHYQGSYLKHALMNIGYGLKWLCFLESKADREFEKTVNNNF